MRPYKSPAANASGGDSNPLAARMSPTKKTIFCMNSADGQQLFVESADQPCPIYEVNFKYPAPLSAKSIIIALSPLITRPQSKVGAKEWRAPSCGFHRFHN